MSAAAWLLACAAAVGAQEAPPPLEAKVRVQPASAELGEPVRLVVELEHPLRLALALDASALRADATWVVLGSEDPLTLPLAGRPGWARTRASFEVASLEPGERALPAVTLFLAEPGSEERTELEAGGAALEVRGLLPEGEVPPPQAKGFLDVEAEEGSARWGWLAALLVLAAAVAAAVGLRRRKQPPVEPPGAAERIAELARGPLDAPEAVQEAYVQASHILRELVDRRRTRAQPGLTDAEWLAAALHDVDGPLRPELEALLSGSAVVKYGQARPTMWAAREHLERARALAQALEPAKAQPPVSGGVAA